MVDSFHLGYNFFMSYQAYEFDSLDLNPNSPFFWDHISRYWWVSNFLKDKVVLDCACGKGYGSYLLSHQAKFVYGIDLNERSLALANTNFGENKNIQFSAYDVTKLASFPEKLDAVVAFEVIEHIPPETTAAFLHGIQEKLGNQGILYLSTPNHEVVEKSGVYVPDFHINNFRPKALKQELENYFSHVQMLGQFVPKAPLQQFVFDFDFWNLRHLLPRSIQSSQPTEADQANAKIENWIHLLQNHPNEAKRYRFSDQHWRQAGLTIAIAHNRNT